MKRYMAMMVWPGLSVLALDQISKLLVLKHIPLHGSIPILTGFFNLVHVRNRGIAFGLFNRTDAQWAQPFLLGAALLAIVIIAIWSHRLKDSHAGILPGLSLILGGAFGNVIDRLRFEAVIDFLDFYVGSYHWPAFNVADSAITVGTFWIGICLLFQRSSHSR